MMKLAERAFRHKAKVILKKSDDTPIIAPIGGYYD